MNARTAALEVLETLVLPYRVTGSDALSLTGYARTTADTDIVVDVAAETYETSLRPVLEALGLYVKAGSLDLAYCRSMAAHLGVSSALEAVVEASNAG